MIKTVSSKVAAHCLRSGMLDHLDDEQLFQACGISRHEVLNPHGRIDARRHFRFLSLLARQPVDFGLPEPTNLRYLFEEYLPVATVCTNAPTLREALTQLVRFRPLIGECDALSLLPQEQGMLIEYQSESEHPSIQQASSMTHFLMINALVCHYIGHASANLSLTLQKNLMPSLKRRLSDLFDCPVEAGSMNGYLIDNTFLDLPYAGFSPTLRGYQLAHAERALFELHPITNLPSQARHLLRQRFLQCNSLSLETETMQTWLCDQLRITRWGLVRRLQQEGITFSALYAQVRGEEACRLLRDSDASMLDISHQLGFANQSSFTRFFKEQQHCTPMQYRQQRPPR